MTKGEKAKELFLSGYNCSQSVVGAFCDEMNIDFDTAMMISSGFGGGIGRLREVCGAFSGAVMVLNMNLGYSTPETGEKKRSLYSHIQSLAEQFRRDNSSIVCRELLGLSEHISSPVPDRRTPEYYKKRPCPQLVEYSANLVDSYLKAHGCSGGKSNGAKG